MTAGATLAKTRSADTLAQKHASERALHGKSLQLLSITTLGRARPEAVLRLTRAIADVGCNILESRMTHLGAEFAMLVLAEGQWDAIARLEQALPRLERELEMRITSQRTNRKNATLDRIPYAVDVICLDQPGVVHNLVDFFIAGDITIAELTTRTYPAVHTGAPMLSVQMAVNIPADMHIGTLREHFTEFCDRFNLDAVLEPFKT
ncbi:MAG TPA: ACT domain-containing protein [Gammaproteobacteria bacterium]|nr:ACT domain-containing protein [Gammaproteobacteria bacterium]